jgi:hypothetical protein
MFKDLEKKHGKLDDIPKDELLTFMFSNGVLN